LQWCPGTAPIIAGSDHFCLPYGKQIFKSQAEIDDLTRIASLEILDVLAKIGSQMEPAFVLVTHGRTKGGKQFNRETSRDQG